MFSLHHFPWLGSNLILKGALDEYGSDNPVNFASWMQYAAVPMIINFLFCWIWLQFWYLGWPKTCKKKQKRTSKDDHSGNSNGVRDVIRQQYKELGPMDCHQIGVLVLFITLIFLWFFRKPQFMMGWSDFFKTKWVKYWVPAFQQQWVPYWKRLNCIEGEAKASRLLPSVSSSGSST